MTSATAHPPQNVFTKNLDVVTLLVGPEKARFVVHKKFLASHFSSFRADLFCDSEAEAQLQLAGEDVDTVARLVHWVYYRTFVEHVDDEDCVTPRDPKVKVMSLIDLYIFGDRYEVPQLRKQSLDGLFLRVHARQDYLSIDHIRKAFQHLHQQDPLCRLLVDACVDEGFAERYAAEAHEDDIHHWPREHLLAYARRCTRILDSLRYNISKLEDFKLDVCDYHEHTSEEDKMACQKEWKLEHCGRDS